MLILMISIAVVLLVSGICLVFIQRGRGEAAIDEAAEEMRIVFPEPGSPEPVPILKDEYVDFLRGKCLDRADNDPLSPNPLCSVPFRNSGNGNGKSSV